MMLDPSSIKPYLTDLDILNQTAEQIKKDFSFFDLEIHFSGRKESAYEELYGQIAPHIERLMERDMQRFMSLLYRIDIKESELVRSTGPGVTQHFTELIIKRCLQKVILRKLYSK